MDAVFVEGVAAVVSATIVFCGSVFLLLMLVLGARLAYFIAATITLAFLFMMGLVWSTNELGPVGELPHYEPAGVAENPSQVEVPEAGSYPESPWRAPEEGVEEDLEKATEVATGAIDALEAATKEGEITAYTSLTDALVDPDSVRLLERDDEQYGAATIGPAEGKEGPTLVAFLRFNPGNPLGRARQITAGTGVLFVAHLVGLGMLERKARNGNAEGNRAEATR